MNFLIKYAPKGKADIVCVEARDFPERIAACWPINAAFVNLFGMGKTTFARLVAKARFCEAKQGSRPCGHCRACVAIDEQWQRTTSLQGYVPGGGSFENIDCSALALEHMRDFRDRITLFKNSPEIFVFDEFHRAKPAVQESFLKLVECPTTSSMLFCFATANADQITKALLQRLTLFVLPTPKVEELTPLVRLVAAEERMRIVDPGAPERLVRACGQVPRLVLKAMEMLAIDGGEVSLRSVQKVVARLKVIDGGKEQPKTKDL